jgi:hypothetical protein
MTGSEQSETGELLKTDVLGRVRVRPEHREKTLDAFEASGMSGQAFALRHGIKVQTFASWMQKRRRQRGDYDDEDKRRELRMTDKTRVAHSRAKPSPKHCLNLIEVCVNPTTDEGTVIPPLEVILPGGAVVRITSERQIRFLKTLLRELPC